MRQYDELYAIVIDGQMKTHGYDADQMEHDRDYYAEKNPDSDVKLVPVSDCDEITDLREMIDKDDLDGKVWQYEPDRVNVGDSTRVEIETLDGDDAKFKVKAQLIMSAGVGQTEYHEGFSKVYKTDAAIDRFIDLANNGEVEFNMH